MKTRHWLTLTGYILVLVLLVTSCSPASTSSAPTTTQEPTSVAPPTTTAAAAKPQGELVAALTTFGGENWLPWLDASMANLHVMVYDLLIYWDHINREFKPGLAESWGVSPDGLTLTYHLRKGIQFQDGWGELTSADVKFNFEMQASPKSTGKTGQTRKIASMETPDPYTLIVHFKEPYPTFYVDLSMANSGVCQGIVSKKYYETVGEDEASLKPIGTGPFRLIESQEGSYKKFEAVDNHWRVVPEFKILTVRLVSETSTLIAALKNREIDCAQVPAEQLTDLKAGGVAVEVSPIGGNLLAVSLGGMVISADKRYNADYHNKDPWTNPKVRQAMSIAIDREAICKAIYAGFAYPAVVPLFSENMDQYKYPYDPEAAKQLIKEAGYPDGFSFRAVSTQGSVAPEIPRIMEALTGYWQQIGLDPKITLMDYNTYYSKNVVPCKTAGDVFLTPNAAIADMLTKAEIFLFPNSQQVIVQDEGSYAIYRDNPKGTFEERIALVDKLNQYYYDNFIPIPVVKNGYCFAWNSEKISPWPHHDSIRPLYFEYIRHAQPLKTFRLFSPWPDR